MDKTPSPDLYDRIITKINSEHRRLLIKRRLMLYATGSIISVGALVPLVKNLYQELNRSDFFEITSLLFTDFRLVMANLADFALSAIESAPLILITLSGLFLMTLIYSTSKFASLIKSADKYNH